MKVSSQNRTGSTPKDTADRNRPYTPPAIVYEGKIDVRAVTGQPLGVGPDVPYPED